MFPRPTQSTPHDKAWHDVTHLLRAWSDGNASARDQLFNLVFDELQQIARHHFARESAAHTLQPTALVHEAYLRLVDQHRIDWRGRAHFFGIASRVMRQILIDHARARQRVKRGGRCERVPLHEVEVPVATVTDHQLIALDDALRELAEINAQQSRIVELRFFAGLGHSEIARVLSISESTAKRHWRTARLWLNQRIRHD